MAQKKSRCSTGFRRKLQTPGLCQIKTVKQSNYRTDLRASQGFHNGPRQILVSPRGDIKEPVQFYSKRQKAEGMQRAVRRNVENVAVLSGKPRGKNRREGDSVR